MEGDWNTTLSPLDKQGGLSWKETKCKNSLIHFIKEIDYKKRTKICIFSKC